MKVTTNEQGVIQLEEVFNGIILKTKDGEEMSICMRDSGFEFRYQGERYFAKEGFVMQFKKSIRGNLLVDQRPAHLARMSERDRLIKLVDQRPAHLARMSERDRLIKSE